MDQSSHNSPVESNAAHPPSLLRRLAEVGWCFLPLGWIAFGGPQAHIALLHEQFVVRRQWLDERRFAELLGLGQGLPGPTSTQMVVAVGTARAGPLGGLVALFCFLYPAVAIMMLAGLGVAQFPADSRPAWLEGVQPAAVALVAVAAWRLGRSLVTTRLTIALMLLGAAVAILWREPWVFPAVLAFGGMVTGIALRNQERAAAEEGSDKPLTALGISTWAGAVLLAIFIGLLVGLILLRLAFDWQLLQWAESLLPDGVADLRGWAGRPADAADRGRKSGVGDRGAVPGRFCPHAGLARPDVQLQRLPGSGGRGRPPGPSSPWVGCSCPGCW